MNASFGNYSPAQYVREDNTISSIGNRFANVAASVPGLIREGEKWQDERNKRSADENQNAYLYDQMQKYSRELGGGEDVLQIRPPNKGEGNNYVLYVGSVIEGVAKNNPQKVEQLLAVATRVGHGNNPNLEDARANSLLQGAGGNAQTAGQGGVGFMGGTLPQGLGQGQEQTPDRFANMNTFDPNDPHISSGEQAQLNAPELEEHFYGPMASAPAPETAPQSGGVPTMIPVQGAGSQVPAGGQAPADRFEASRQNYVNHWQRVIDNLNGKDGMDGEIQRLEKQLASLENGGMRLSPHAKDIRDQLEKKRAQLDKAMDKIHDANKPEKVDYSANEEKRKQEMHNYKKNKPYYNPNPGTLQLGGDFYRALQNSEQKGDNLMALQVQMRALQEKIGKTEDPKVKSRLKQKEAELQTAINDAEERRLTAEKIVYEADRSGTYRNANKPERVNMMKKEAKTIINSQITNRLSGQVFGSKMGAPELSKEEMSRINTAVKASANKMGLDEKDTQEFIAEVNRLSGSIITGKPIK
jgi:hypothetical protein